VERGGIKPRASQLKVGEGKIYGRGLGEGRLFRERQEENSRKTHEDWDYIEK